jgi:hypothetical protein
MKPLQIGLFVVAGGFGGALLMHWQSRHHPTTEAMAVRMPVAMMKSPMSPPMPSPEPYEPPVPAPQLPDRVAPSWQPPRLTPMHQPARVPHATEPPFTKASYHRIPARDSMQRWHRAFVFPLPGIECGPMKAAESEKMIIGQLELGLIEVIEALREWTTASASARGVRPSPPATSTGWAVWRRDGPRDAFGRLQTY